MKKFLAVDQYHDVYIEDSEAVVDFAIVNEIPIRHFEIKVDEYGSPTLIEVTKVTK